MLPLKSKEYHFIQYVNPKFDSDKLNEILVILKL